MQSYAHTPAARIRAGALLMALLAPSAAQDLSPAGILDALREADARFRSEDWAAAGPLLERVAEQNPHIAGVWLRLGITCSGTGEHARAIAAYERALELVQSEPERRFLERRLAELS